MIIVSKQWKEERLLEEQIDDEEYESDKKSVMSDESGNQVKEQPA